MKLSFLLQNVRTMSAYTDSEIKTIICDSHGVTPGSLFVCMTGNEYEDQTAAKLAVAAGAAAVITQRDTGVENQILVEDAGEAFALVCAAYFGHPAQKLKLLGVCGTNGKTAAAYALKDILESAGMKTGLTGSLQNNTTADSFELHRRFAEMAEAGCECGVVTVSSPVIEQKIIEGIRFDTFVFIDLARDDLNCPDDYDKRKAAIEKLFEQSALAVINMDDNAGEAFINKNICPCVTYSVKTDSSDYTAKNIHMKESGVEYELVGRGVIGRVCFRQSGAFSVYSSMGAAVCAAECGIPFRQVIEALAGSTGENGGPETVQAICD